MVPIKKHEQVGEVKLSRRNGIFFYPVKERKYKISFKSREEPCSLTSFDRIGHSHVAIF